MWQPFIALFLGMFMCTQLHAAVQIDRAAVYNKVMAGNLESPEQALVLFPQSPDEVTQRAEQAVATAKKEMDSWLAIPAQERTVENTIRRFDAIAASFDNVRNCLETTVWIEADAKLLEALKGKMSYLVAQGGEIFQNERVFKVFNSFEQYVACSGEDKLFLDKILASFAQNRSSDSTVNQRIKQIDADCVRISQEYTINQNKADKKVILTVDDMPGVSDEQKNSFARQDEDYIIDLKASPLDVSALSPEGRDKLFRAKLSDVGKVNKSLVEQFIRLKNEKSRLLGYKSYTDNQMAGAFFGSSEVFDDCMQTIQTSLYPHSVQRGVQVVEKAKALSKDECLDGDKIRYTSNRILKNDIKKAEAQDDSVDLADYFVIPQLLEKTCKLYERFGDVRITLAPAGVIDGDIYRFFLNCYQGDNNLTGVSVINAYPSYKKPGGATFPLVMPARGKTKVTAVCMQYDKINHHLPVASNMYTIDTVIHELGHMMSFFGNNQLQAFAGLGLWDPVSRVSSANDFAEFEGVAIEQLCYFPEMLMHLSEHIQTSEKLAPEQAAHFTKKGAEYDIARYSWSQGAALAKVCQKDHTFEQAQDIFWQTYAAYQPEVKPLYDLPWLADYLWLVASGYGPLMYKYGLARFTAHHAVQELKRQGLDVWQIGRQLTQKGIMQSGSLSSREVIESVTGKPFVLKQALKSYLEDLIEMAS